MDSTSATTSQKISAEALGSKWSDSDLVRLSRCIVDWEAIAPVLFITEAEEREIKEDNPHDYQMQKYALLRKWKSKAEDSATYGQLIRVFRSIKEMGLVDHVNDILLHPEEPATASNVLACYQEFLQKSYRKTPHPSLLTDQWPVMKKPVFVSLSLVKEEKDGPKKRLKRVSLNEIANKNFQANRILIYGLPGSGKTTLTWHVSQLWAKKELFKQFTIFLTIPLRSKQVQQATCLADLIPHPDQEQRIAIAQALSTSHGDGVCFWFDGWDEMPEEIQNKSFVASFIQQDAPQSSLPDCTIAVTSRSSSGLYGFTVVGLENLNQAQIEELVVKNTKDTGHNANELLTALESKAALSRFCCLPITVTILIHLFFTFGTSLPTTQTELFRCLILNLLLRNLQTRWLLPVKILENFSSLPEFANKCFQNLCKLAYDGIMVKKALFRPSDIPNLQLPLPLATLGLMRINPHIEWFGIDEELTFIHSTIQEFLAAYHLSSFSPGEQVRDLNKIMKTEHAPVFAFFGGLTKFSETKEFLPHQNCYTIDWFDNLFFLMTEGLYEANIPRLCQIVKRRSSVRIDRNHVLIEAQMEQPTLTPAQMVPLGYFIAHLCSQKTCTLNLLVCQFSRGAVESFVRTIISEWDKLESKPKKPNLTLLVSDDHISQAAKAISKLIEHTNLLHTLKISFHMSSVSLSRPMPADFKYGPRLTMQSTLKPLIGALSKNSSMSCLSMKFHFPWEREMRTLSMIAYSEYYIVLLLTFCPGLKMLGLHEFFHYGHFYRLVSAAIGHNQTLEKLDLNENFFLREFKPSFDVVANGIGLNSFLTWVSLNDSVKEESLLSLLKILHERKSLLKIVEVDSDIEPNDEIQSQIRAINKTRLRHRFLLRISCTGTSNYAVCNGFICMHSNPLPIYNPLEDDENDEDDTKSLLFDYWQQE